MAIIKALLRAVMVGVLAAVFGGAIAMMLLARTQTVVKVAIDCGLFACLAYLRQNRALADAAARLRGAKKEKSPAG